MSASARAKAICLVVVVDTRSPAAVTAAASTTRVVVVVLQANCCVIDHFVLYLIARRVARRATIMRVSDVSRLIVAGARWRSLARVSCLRVARIIRKASDQFEAPMSEDHNALRPPVSLSDAHR